MAQEHLSEHERLLDVEQKVSDLQRSVGQINTTISSLRTALPVSGLDFVQLKGYPGQAALFEQTLALLRSIYLTPMLMAPPMAEQPTVTLVGGCAKVTFTDRLIERGKGIFFQIIDDATNKILDSTAPGATPASGCLTISTALVDDGRAEVEFCCSSRPCPKALILVTAERPDPDPAKPPISVGVRSFEFGCP